MEKTYCLKCDKDITEETKYTTIGFNGWYCKKCYFGSNLEVLDKDYGKSKITFDYN
jgi:transposase-like protein